MLNKGFCSTLQCTYQAHSKRRLFLQYLHTGTGPLKHGQSVQIHEHKYRFEKLDRFTCNTKSQSWITCQALWYNPFQLLHQRSMYATSADSSKYAIKHIATMCLFAARVGRISLPTGSSLRSGACRARYIWSCAVQDKGGGKEVEWGIGWQRARGLDWALEGWLGLAILACTISYPLSQA